MSNRGRRSWFCAGTRGQYFIEFRTFSIQLGIFKTVVATALHRERFKILTISQAHATKLKGGKTSHRTRPSDKNIVDNVCIINISCRHTERVWRKLYHERCYQQYRSDKRILVILCRRRANISPDRSITAFHINRMYERYEQKS